MAERHNVRVLDGDPWHWPRVRAAVGPDAAAACPRAIKAHALSPELLSSLVTHLPPGAVQPLADGAALIVATEGALQSTLDEAIEAPWHTLLQEALDALSYCRAPRNLGLRVRGVEFVWGQRTVIMGIVNVTPDSFSGDGLLSRPVYPEEVVARAVAQGLRMVAEGADILDMGGESTRPGAQPLSASEEMARIVPVIRALRAQTEMPLSVDTYKASVAAAALDAGADMINDVWGLRMDPDMGPLAAARGVPVALMHNRSRPRDAAQQERLGGRYVGVHYDDLMAEVLAELRAQVDAARHCGIRPERILIDPGIGFGKTVEQNRQLVASLSEFRVLGYPLLLGASRKSWVGYTLDLPAGERLEGSLAAAVAGVLHGGADILRVHDVQATVRAVRLAEAVRAAWGTP